MKHSIRRSPEEALRASVESLGGLQEVGHGLKPESDPVLAGQWLAHCLSRDKRDKLSLAQIVHIFKRAHGAGEHDGFAVFALLCGYQVNPVGIDAELAAAVKRAQDAAVEAAEASKHLQMLAENPELMARMKAAGLNVGELA